MSASGTNETRGTERRCARCGKTFLCDAQGKCWCGGIALGEETLKILRANYVDCLCEECLTAFAATKN